MLQYSEMRTSQVFFSTEGDVPSHSSVSHGNLTLDNSQRCAAPVTRVLSASTVGNRSDQKVELYFGCSETISIPQTFKMPF